MEPRVRAPFSRRGNLQKYLSRNPLQRFLIWYFHRRVGELVAASGASGILDVGCGEGFTIDRLLSTDGHLPIQGLDYDFRALLQAKEKHPHVVFQMGDIRRLPFAADRFELVLCLEVLEHLPDPPAALEELRRVSCRHCLISVPNEPFFMLANSLRGKNIRMWGNDPEHLHNWTARQFIHMMEDYFQVERVLYPFPWVLALCRK
jgi:ubiquinone/menaquinone biosynthesis C-methylase UbiE